MGSLLEYLVRENGKRTKLTHKVTATPSTHEHGHLQKGHWRSKWSELWDGLLEDPHCLSVLFTSAHISGKPRNLHNRLYRTGPVRLLLTYRDGGYEICNAPR